MLITIFYGIIKSQDKGRVNYVVKKINEQPNAR